jgi:hypothetical protein
MLKDNTKTTHTATQIDCPTCIIVQLLNLNRGQCPGAVVVVQCPGAVVVLPRCEWIITTEHAFPHARPGNRLSSCPKSPSRLAQQAAAMRAVIDSHTTATPKFTWKWPECLIVGYPGELTAPTVHLPSSNGACPRPPVQQLLIARGLGDVQCTKYTRRCLCR